MLDAIRGPLYSFKKGMENMIKEVANKNRE